MICRKCGREHQNPKGVCPFCRVPGRMSKRYRHGAAEQEEADRISRLTDDVDRNWRAAKQERLAKI
jgi:hypothetical protein